MSITLIVTIFLTIFAIITIWKSIVIVQQSQCLVVERLGSFNRTLSNGLNLLIPFVDNARELYWIDSGTIYPSSRIDLRETVLDIPEQSVITRDNVSINIDALLYLQIMDPIKATYEISNLPLAVAQLTQTTLRNVIGEMDLDESLVSRDIINSKLKVILDEATDKWGTKVNRVELKNITPPADIQQAMEKQMQAERERRAKVLEAEGDKQARIQRSEGTRQEQINLAEGDKESQLRRAQGEADAIREIATAKKQAIDEIKSSLNADADLTAKFILTANYIDQLEKFTQKPGDKVFIPYEASTALSSLGSLKELLKSSTKS